MLTFFAKSHLKSNLNTYSTLLSAAILLISIILVSLSLLTWLQVLLLSALTLCLCIYVSKFSDQHSPYWQLFIFPIIILAFFISTHHEESVSNIVIFSEPEIHPGGQPFSLQLNLGKTCAGYLLLIWLLPIFRQDTSPPLRIKLSTFITLIFTTIILTVATLALNLKAVTKPILLVALFLPINALTTCVSEEVFFRLGLQKPLENFLNGFSLSNFLIRLIPLIFTTSIFVVLHQASNVDTIVTFGLAGFLYGLIYVLTHRIVFSILLHTLVNALHFAFLTYPV